MARTPRSPLPGLDAPNRSADDLKARLVVVGAEQGFTSRTPEPARVPIKTKPLHVELSEALFRQITLKAAELDVTKRYIIVDALRRAGFDVSQDEYEDGRKPPR